MNGVFNLPQAARYLGVSQTQMARLLELGLVAGHTEPNGHYRKWQITRDALDAYAEHREYDTTQRKERDDVLPVSSRDYVQNGYEHRRPLTVTIRKPMTFTPVDDGVRCCECGGVVYNAPRVLAALRWRCPACSATAQRQTAALLTFEPHLQSIRPGEYVPVVRDYLNAHGNATRQDIMALFPGDNPATVFAALQGSRHLVRSYVNGVDVWRLRK